ncbi:MAG: DNA adenine methylase, partial [Polyangiaceae bacterium]|nr:DNA adenine methylase [Polyangiaceae bacterium]
MASEDLGSVARLTFKGNLRTTRYGWLRLTPAYSVHLVGELLDRVPIGSGKVLDPFCGTGTTALVCAERGIRAQTTDINPFLVWLARAKARRYT